MGREVLSQRECTRDAEWKLMHLTLLNLDCNSEVSGKLHASLTLQTKHIIYWNNFARSFSLSPWALQTAMQVPRLTKLPPTFSPCLTYIPVTHATGLEHVEQIQKEQMTASYKLWVMLTRLLATSSPALLLLLPFMDLNGSLCKRSCCLMEDQPCSWNVMHPSCRWDVWRRRLERTAPGCERRSTCTDRRSTSLGRLTSQTTLPCSWISPA
jgi:hypothetical protein